MLLTESQINAGAVNMRGQNPLHVLANYPKDNAAAIADVFLEAMPDYDLNRVDVEGNSGEGPTKAIQSIGKLCVSCDRFVLVGLVISINLLCSYWPLDTKERKVIKNCGAFDIRK